VRYDVAISFAGEQRAEAIAACLRNAGVDVFYDGYELAVDRKRPTPKHNQRERPETSSPAHL
jgi:hypothetical protein